jgi:hypothetical protein
MEQVLQEKKKQMIEKLGPAFKYSTTEFCVECLNAIRYTGTWYPYSSYVCLDCSNRLLKK